MRCGAKLATNSKHVLTLCLLICHIFPILFFQSTDTFFVLRLQAATEPARVSRFRRIRDSFAPGGYIGCGAVKRGVYVPVLTVFLPRVLFTNIASFQKRKVEHYCYKLITIHIYPNLCPAGFEQDGSSLQVRSCSRFLDC